MRGSRSRSLRWRLHVDSELEAGKIRVSAGVSFTDSDSCDAIVMKGQGGHGSPAGGQYRSDPAGGPGGSGPAVDCPPGRSSPFDQAVVTGRGRIRCRGRSTASIRNTCRLQLTIRSYTPEIRQKLGMRLRGRRRRWRTVIGRLRK